MLRKLFLTARHLSLTQINFYLLKRFFLKRKIFPLEYEDKDCRFEVFFCFLNLRLPFNNGCWGGKGADISRLWAYNLHYFNYLWSESYTEDQKNALLDSWIEKNIPGSIPGWEPYPLSLRVVNWCRYFHQIDEPIPGRWHESLYQQASWLRTNIEWHILANHLFENLKALIFVGSYFNDINARKWLRKAQLWFGRELDEQFLSDGCHYERSPTYHCLMLSGLLDLLEWQRSYPSALGLGLNDKVRGCAQKALEWLAAVQLPGDSYPLFNDSAFDAAPRPAALFRRASTLGLDWRVPSSGLVPVCLPESGIFGVNSDPSVGDALLIKCGDIGPPYQPGHTHCDMLSFEWYVGGKAFIVDTGVYEYEPGLIRYYERSTEAHNTLQVDSSEQSEIWGEFRVARRAKVKYSSFNKINLGYLFQGEIEGFHNLGKIRHRRELRLQIDKGIRGISVSDTVLGKGEHRLTSRLLFHPDIKIKEQSKGRFRFERKGEEIAELQTNVEICEVIYAPYFPEFGLRFESYQIAMRSSQTLPGKIDYNIKLL